MLVWAGSTKTPPVFMPRFLQNRSPVGADSLCMLSSSACDVDGIRVSAMASDTECGTVGHCLPRSYATTDIPA